MKTIGITGGIGSGKTTVSRIFETLDIPVYYSDERAKAMYFLPDVKAKVIGLLGAAAYKNEKEIDRSYIASKIFSDTTLLQQINNIIHPAVAADFESWKQDQQNVPFVLKESAILFETGIYKKLDATILVVCPEDVRAERIAARDKISKEEVLKRFQAQLSDEKKIPLANYIIHNDEEHSLIKQVIELKNQLGK